MSNVHSKRISLNFLAKTKNKTSLLLQIGIFLILFIFLIVPIIAMLFKMTGDDLKYVFNDSTFYQSLGNSLLYSFLGATISTLLATIAAFLLSRINIRYKKLIVLFLTIPMLIPTISVGLGIRNLFRTNGLMEILFNIKFDGLGMFDLVFGSIIFSFPVVFLLIYDALIYENRVVYDASSTLGISKIKSFFGITIPYLRGTLISGFFASFVLIFADYGLPMEVAGKVKTLPMYLYEQVLSMFDYGRGAVISFVLIIPAIILFIFDTFNKETSSDNITYEQIKPTKAFNIIGITIIIIIGLFLLIPQLSFIIISFVKRFPSDMSFTFDNFKNAFSTYSSVNVISFLFNSIIIALLTGFFGTILTYICGYLSTRTNGKFKRPLQLISLATLAVPGLTLGIGYIFLFNNTQGFFYGTIAILVVVNIIHYFSSPYIMAKNTFNKLNKDFEAVADTLGISRFKMFFSVLVPSSLSTIFQMFSYLFINSMITISAVSFLCTYSTQPLAIAISTYENQSVWEMEAVISFLLLIINIIAKLGFDFLSRFLYYRNIKEKRPQNEIN